MPLTLVFATKPPVLIEKNGEYSGTTVLIPIRRNPRLHRGPAPASAESSVPVHALCANPWPGWRSPSVSQKGLGVRPLAVEAADKYRKTRPYFRALPGPIQNRRRSRGVPFLRQALPEETDTTAPQKSQRTIHLCAA